MKKFAGIVLFVLVSACVDNTPPNTAVITKKETIYRWHDDSTQVTCWITTGGYAPGISCLPDSSIRRIQQ